MKKSESQKRVEATDILIADAIFEAIDKLTDLTYGEIICALANNSKRYAGYLVQTESEESNVD